MRVGQSREQSSGTALKVSWFHIQPPHGVRWSYRCFVSEPASPPPPQNDCVPSHIDKEGEGVGFEGSTMTKVLAHSHLYSHPDYDHEAPRESWFRCYPSPPPACRPVILSRDPIRGMMKYSGALFWSTQSDFLRHPFMIPSDLRGKCEIGCFNQNSRTELLSGLLLIDWALCI